MEHNKKTVIIPCNAQGKIEDLINYLNQSINEKGATHYYMILPEKYQEELKKRGLL